MAMTPRLGAADATLDEMNLDRPLRRRTPRARRRNFFGAVAKHTVAIFFLASSS